MERLIDASNHNWATETFVDELAKRKDELYLVVRAELGIIVAPQSNVS